MVSKSEFLLFKKHPCWLWLFKHERSKLPKVDANLQRLFEDGKELESYAEQRYPDGVRGQADLDPGTTHFQKRFELEGFECTSDIVLVNDDGSLSLIEIKSSTKAKEDHVFDLAFQKRLIEMSGHRVSSTGVLHINNQYILIGELDVQALFALTNVTEQVEAYQTIDADMTEAKRIAGMATMPDASIRHCGSHDGDIKKDWLKVMRGLRPIPEASIFELPYLKLEQMAELEDQGILEIAAIPDDYKLRKDQERLREALRRGTCEVNKEGLGQFIQGLQYPLYFLDYESLALAVPAFQETKPYQQVTFQYSLHIQDQSGEPLRHLDHIHDSNDHPFPIIARKLRDEISDVGSIIVWNETFEKGRNKELGTHVPELAAFFEDVNSRIVDLMVPFKQGHYDDPSFLGSASIKKVLPVLAPDLTYDDLEVKEGKSASRLWREAVVDGSMSDKDKQRTLDNLKTYCELDTFAMVRILGAIQGL